MSKELLSQEGANFPIKRNHSLDRTIAIAKEAVERIRARQQQFNLNNPGLPPDEAHNRFLISETRD